MDQSLKDPDAFLRSVMTSGDSLYRPGDRVFPISQAMAGREPAWRGDAAPAPSPAPVRDWSSAIELIEEASQAIRINEDRVRDLEEQLHDVTRQADEEVQRLNLQIAAADQKLQLMTTAARAAEARAIEAETWLARVHDAVVKTLKPGLRATRTLDDGSGQTSEPP